MRPSTARLRRGLRDLASAMYRAHVPLSDLRMWPVGVAMQPVACPLPTPDGGYWQHVSAGTRWGGVDQTVWFHATASVSKDWIDRLADAHAVVLRLWLGAGVEDGFGWPEGLLYVNTRLQQGINRHHPDVLLRDEDVVSGPLRFDVRAWSGLLEADHRIELAEIALLDRECEALYHLLLAGADVVEALSENDPLTAALVSALESAYDAVDLHTVGAVGAEALARSARAVLPRLRESLADLRARYDPAERPVVTAVGHGHLDVAWLWQIRHTREKTARTFGVATALMERYPDYTFLHSTPQVFAWLEADFPELYARVAARVREGRFEAAGAMWVESDCNLVSGESLVRQIGYGQQYLRERFGREYDTLWLPDAFGYSAALPQIMLRSGLRAFMTTKLSWNDTNRMPADTFRWRGIDGSTVLAHFITTPAAHAAPPIDKTDTYNGTLDVSSVLGSWRRYRQKGINNEVLLAYGHGDGGAGPTRQFIEQARALRELPGVPVVRLGRADAFFARLRERIWHDARLPGWDGELYLEYHRGTFTTQAWLKRVHRHNEARLLLAELLDAWHWAIAPNTAPDRRSALDDAWRTLLLHEFHDILPGSSIGPVYHDAREAMTALAQTLEALISDATRAIVVTSGTAPGAVVALNSCPWARTVVLELPTAESDATSFMDSTGRPLPTQPTCSDGRAVTLVELSALPALGIAVITPGDHGGGARADASGEGDGEPARGDGRVLENAFFRLTVNERGELTSIVDKRVPGGRELLPPGERANRLEAFDDRPLDFDAWNIDETFDRKRYEPGNATVALVESGPLRATLRMTCRLLSSTIEQRISLYRAIPRIDFATRIDWHDQHILLKVAFPLDLRTTHATSEVQFGSVERPTHRNTSWEQARFETVAHRWVDLSEADYGVSLLNDGLYGHDVSGSTVRLTLLRSPTMPDPEADQGEHAIIYSLYPHLGDWRSGGTVPAAYALNRPVHVERLPATSAAGGVVEAGAHGAYGFFRAAPGNVVLESIKRPMEGAGIVVRIYEAHGSRCVARIHSAMPIAGVEECDLLERPLQVGTSAAYAEWEASAVASHDIPVADANGWSCDLRPFEIRTFRVLLRAR